MYCRRRLQHQAREAVRVAGVGWGRRDAGELQCIAMLREMRGLISWLITTNFPHRIASSNNPDRSISIKFKTQDFFIYST